MPDSVSATAYSIICSQHLYVSTCPFSVSSRELPVCIWFKYFSYKTKSNGLYLKKTSCCNIMMHFPSIAVLAFLLLFLLERPCNVLHFKRNNTHNFGAGHHYFLRTVKRSLNSFRFNAYIIRNYSHACINNVTACTFKSNNDCFFFIRRVFIAQSTRRPC